MTAKQNERLVVAAENLASAALRFATIAEKFHASMFPKKTNVKGEAEVYRAGERTYPEPQSTEEYRALPNDLPGRFQTLVEQATRPKAR